MIDKDRKLSQKLQGYLKERGELKKMVYRLKKRINQIESEQQNNKEGQDNEIDMTNYDQNIPQACFKCQYNIILWNEGRAKAMRIFQVAQNQLSNDAENIQGFQSFSKSLGPIKNRTAHMTSSEMDSLQLMQGTFFDYRRQREEDRNQESYSPNYKIRSQHAQSNPLIAKQIQKLQNQQLLVSLAKENPLDHQLSFNSNNQTMSYNQLYTPTTNSIKNYMTTYGRQWHQDFTDKLTQKIANLNSVDRQQKILRKLQKERAKYMTGNRLHIENQKVLEEYQKNRRKGMNEGEKVRLKRNIPDVSDAYNSREQTVEEGSGLRNQELQSIGSNKFQVNKSDTSTNKEYFNNRIFNSNKRIDKTFFRKLSSLGAFANAAFNNGVFLNPPVDQI